MTKNRYKYAPAPVTKSKYSTGADEWNTPANTNAAAPANSTPLGLDDKAGADMEDKPLIEG
jgi:hypothetical protein